MRMPFTGLKTESPSMAASASNRIFWHGFQTCLKKKVRCGVFGGLGGWGSTNVFSNLNKLLYMLQGAFDCGRLIFDIIVGKLEKVKLNEF